MLKLSPYVLVREFLQRNSTMKKRQSPALRQVRRVARVAGMYCAFTGIVAAGFLLMQLAVEIQLLAAAGPGVP